MVLLVIIVKEKIMSKFSDKEDVSHVIMAIKCAIRLARNSFDIDSAGFRLILMDLEKALKEAEGIKKEI